MFIVIVGSDAHAEIERDDRLWITYQLDHAIDEHLKVILQIQPYWRDEMTHRDQITLRPGLLWKLNNTMTIGGGYAYNLGFTDSHQHAYEQRLWEELGVLVYSSDGWNIHERTRIEHRQFDHQGELATGVRQLVKMSYPLREDLFLSVSDEIYWNINNTERIASGFDQNRFFIGVLRPVTKNLSIETGYLNQFVKSVSEDRINHVLAFNITHAF